MPDSRPPSPLEPVQTGIPLSLIEVPLQPDISLDEAGAPPQPDIDHDVDFDGLQGSSQLDVPCDELGVQPSDPSLAEPLLAGIETFHGWPTLPHPIKSSATSLVLDIALDVTLICGSLTFVIFALIVWFHDQAETASYPHLTKTLVNATQYVSRDSDNHLTEFATDKRSTNTGSECFPHSLRLCAWAHFSGNSAMATREGRVCWNTRFTGGKYVFNQHCDLTVQAAALQHIRSRSCFGLGAVARWRTGLRKADGNWNKDHHSCRFVRVHDPKPGLLHVR